MDPITGPTNQITNGAVKLVARLSWSQRRAWPGDKVKMQLRTELVADNVDVEFQVQTSADAPVEVEKVDGKKVTGGELDSDYEIAWKDKPFGTEREFKLAAKVGEQLEAVKSRKLYVDLDSPLFSA